MDSRIRFRVLKLIGLLGVWSSAYSATGSVDLSGKVNDSWGHPLVKVAVTLASLGATTTTDSTGAWRLSGASVHIQPRRTFAEASDAARLAFVDGRLFLWFQGCDASGSSRRLGSVAVEQRGAPRSVAATAVDTLVFAWDGRERSRMAVSSLAQGALGTQVVDLTALMVPILTDSGGIGDVTTYGGVGNSKPSVGGACNYGSTGIPNYAAIQVSLLPGDLAGQWNGGHICGQCARVRAWTSSGWHTTFVRITDECPDDDCGIDLGGAPATDIMGTLAGRYAGSWTFVPCPGLTGVSDAPKSLWVKDGSSVYWSLVQVRNPPSAVDSLRLRPTGGAWTSLPWATEADNFFKVPVGLLQDTTANLQVEINYRLSPTDSFQTKAALFTHAGTTFAIP